MDLDPRTKRRIDRINKVVAIDHLLEDFGLSVQGGVDREQQFPCTLHGDGTDMTPSARIYPDSVSWYCWGCQKSRDAIETVREVRGLGFIEAIRWLETKYKLPTMEWEAEDHRYERLADAVQIQLRKNRTLEDDIQRVRTLLDNEARNVPGASLPMEASLALWEAFDKVVHLATGDSPQITEHKARVTLERLRLMAEEKIGV